MSAKINITTHYPYSDKYVYETFLELIDLDKERIKDITTGNGFIISSPKAIKDTIKDENGILSSRYGQTLQDQNPFGDRYRCLCGRTTTKINNGQTCEYCGQKVVYVGDRFKYFGWAVLKDPYHIIHPNLYKNISALIGRDTFDEIISPNMAKNEDGKEVTPTRGKDEPYKNIGMVEFYNKFDEIIDYYLAKHPTKKDHYDLIKQNREKVFSQSLPVFTTHLRPYKLEGGELHYEKTNETYSIMVSLLSKINDDRYAISRKAKPKAQLLYNLQKKYLELDAEIDAILSSKKGVEKCVLRPYIEIYSEKNFLNCWDVLIAA